MKRGRIVLRSQAWHRVGRSAAVMTVIAAIGLVGVGATAAPAKHKPPKPAVTKITPSHGSTKGGTTVTVKGTHLGDPRRILLGTTKIKKIYPITRHKVQFTAPPHAAGAVHVRVVTKAGTSAKNASDKFTYAKPTPPAGMQWSSAGPIEDPAGNPRSVSCPTTSFCVAVDFRGAALTFNGTNWSRPTDVNDGYQLWTVSCTSATFCIAAGDGYDDLFQADVTNTFLYNGTKWTPLGELPAGVYQHVSCVTTSFCMLTEGTFSLSADTYVVYNGTKWKDPKAIGDGSSLGVASVSCTSTTFCMAVGSDTANAVAAASTFNGTTWTTPSAYGPASSYAADVSCASSTSCTAVGGIYVGAPLGSRWNGTTWSTHTFDANAYIKGVSCGSGSQCEAVGTIYKPSDSTQKGWAASFDTSSWTEETTGLGGQLTAVSCASASNCMAVGDFRQPSYTHSTTAGDRSVFHLNGYAVHKVGGSWGTPDAMDPAEGDGLSGISCPTTTFCAMVDLGGTVVTWDHGTFAPPVAIAADHAQFNNDIVFSAGLSSVSCGSPTFCVAVGSDIDTDFNDNFGYASVWNGTHWTQAQDIDDDAAIFDVSCVASGRCVAVGDTGQVVVYDNGSWSAPKNVDGSDFIQTISCTSATFCVAGSQGGKAIVTTNGDDWSTSTVDASHGLSTVDCTSTTFCLAVTADGNERTYNGTSWSSAKTITNTDAAGIVSCVSPTFCVAADIQTGNGFTYNGTTWSNAKLIDQLSYRGSAITGLDCVTTKLCFGTDYFGYLLVGAG